MIKIKKSSKILKVGKISMVLSSLLTIASFPTLVNADVISTYSTTLLESNKFYQPHYSPHSGTSYSDNWTPENTDFTAQSTSLFSFEATTLSPSDTGVYTIETTDANLSDGRNDTLLMLYSTFDVDHPENNIIFANDDIVQGVNVLSHLVDINLTSGNSYVLVLTTWQAGTTGSLTYTVTGPGTMLFTLYSDKNYFDQTVASAGATPAQRTAGLFDDINDNGDGNSNEFIQHLNTLGTDTEVSKAITEVAPDVSTTAFGSATHILRRNAGIVEQRQKNLAGANSGDELFNEKNFWAKPFGSWGKQDNKDSLNGYTIRTYGLGLGFDRTNKDYRQFGMGLFYTNADVDVNNVSQTSDVDAYSVFLYGSMPVIDTKTKLLYQLGYSWQKTDTYKDAGIGTATADYTSTVTSLKVELMRDYKVNNKFLLNPITGLSYTYYKSPKYTETITNLTVNKFSTSELLLSIGANAEYILDENSKLLASINLDYNLQNKNDSINVSNSLGTTVSYDTIDNGRVGYSAGLGYEEIDDLSSINISFDYDGKGSDYKNATISAKYIYNF